MFDVSCLSRYLGLVLCFCEVAGSCSDVPWYWRLVLRLLHQLCQGIKFWSKFMDFIDTFFEEFYIFKLLPLVCSVCGWLGSFL